ncbi:M23 family metallopeptidase [Sphingomonas sanguinis]|jgi:murein DD-endopeptidase MepM/ murein hydrolase activator NlpD|uniref:M23 family metallopeptidase n=1 Tax=Sphingomonas sanguinis TaxID=33051 RepID=A0A7Y7UQN4_9SPHN|nr:M23 family metallopeptidase [Sphingomonas sanguinis]MBZ6381147.1 M23 family metallopeptidase [Sphingomonas sanguinis]NNG50951.1 M23 family metallopeptidase [Sphingomonas sanguinis]NNG55198.1 M23 family metallopeptidase [Sphingomonas sanguinis]NVP30450.1 M23 family metallopeptidase [Sphingomonas sanguinis]
MTYPHDEEPSFDPRSWIERRAVSVPQLSTQDRISDAPAKAPRAFRRGSRALPWIAGLAIAASGAVVAMLARPDHVDTQAATAPIAQPSETLENRTLVIASAADLGPTLAAAGVSPADGRAALGAIGDRLQGKGDIRLTFTLAHRGDAVRLAALDAVRDDGSGVTLVSKADGFVATPLAAHLRRVVRFVRGELDGQSFYSSAVAAGVSDVLIGPFVNAFRYDFDMQREVAPGDVFEAGFAQRVTAEGTPVGSPELVYASLSTAAKSRALYRFQAPGDAQAEWYDSSGRSSRTAFMRTPVEAARISSGFGMRGHPILGFWKMHKGTDFAAPTGTPIYAAGDAVVTFAGPKGPNGNFVRLHHANGWDTLYLHMNRIMAGIAPGSHVAQGQQIGEVGTTGRSTGPHLHYEVHIDGQPVDPMSIKVDGGRSLTGEALKRFRAQRDRIDATRVTSAT